MALQHVDPTAPKGAARKAYAGLLRTPVGRWFAINVAAPLDPWLLRKSKGKVGFGMMIPSARLETTGAKSGAPRENAVLYFHDGADVVLIASSFGRDRNPAWSYNLKTHPDCVLAGDSFSAAAVDEEDERNRLWKLADTIYPGYADYRERTAAIGRRIPIFRLTPR